MLGVKQVVYKSKKIAAEFCTICNEFLSGNGSSVTPYKCACGEYQYSWKKGGFVHPKESEIDNIEKEIR